MDEGDNNNQENGNSGAQNPITSHQVSLTNAVLSIVYLQSLAMESYLALRGQLNSAQVLPSLPTPPSPPSLTSSVAKIVVYLDEVKKWAEGFIVVLEQIIDGERRTCA